MDAEIWSYADTKNGRLILRVLTVVILLKEVTVMILPVFGLPVIDPIWSLPADDGAPFPLRGPVMLAIKLVLLLCVHAAFFWARAGLALLYLLTSIVAIGLTLGVSLRPEGLGPALTVANALIGLVIAAVLMISAQLKAYLWRKAVTRFTIPIPDDDEPQERRSRRTHTLGEHVMITVQRLLGLVMLAAVLGAIAYLYGFSGPLLDAFGR